jgi:hypothetical protein
MGEPGILMAAKLQSWIYINTEFKQLICKRCQRAIRSHELVAHLLKKHKKKKGIAVGQLITQLAWMDPPEKTIPDNGLSPQPHIRVFQQSKCRQCPFVPFMSDDDPVDMDHHWKSTTHKGYITRQVQAWYGAHDPNCWSVVMTNDKIEEVDGQQNAKWLSSRPEKFMWYQLGYKAEDFHGEARKPAEGRQTDEEFVSIQADALAMESKAVLVDGDSDACKDEDGFVMV